MTRLRALLLLLALFVSATVPAREAPAPDPLPSLPTVDVVQARDARTNLGGEASAQPAAVVVITADEIAEMQVDHVLDLFRDRAGIVVRQLNQGDIGDDFGLRGFAGGHGVDAAVFVDGVPMNQVNGRTHGLVDLNWLVPSMIERIEVIKGPWSVRHGNFALGGTVLITTRGGAETGALTLGAGGYGHASIGLVAGDADGVLVGEALRREGYRDAADSQCATVFARRGYALADGQLTLAVQADRREFAAPGYLPVDAVRAGLRDRRDAVNASDGGEVEHAQAWAAWTGALPGAWQLDGRAYVVVDERSRFADLGSGQSATLTDIETLGASLVAERVDVRHALAFGLHLRRDSGTRRAFRANRRVPGVATSDRAARAREFGLWAELQWRPTDELKITTGVRADRVDTTVTNRLNPGASGRGDADATGPRVGIAWQPAERVELYANRGRGFRSPSQVELSPDARGARFQPLDAFEIDSADLGVRLDLGAGLSADLALYRTDTEDEVVQVAPGEFANLGATTRDGAEGELRWRGDGVEAFVGAATVDASLVTDAAARAVTGVPTGSQVAGFTIRNDDWTLDAYGQRYASAPLDATGRSRRSPVRNFGIRLTRRLETYTAALQVSLNPDDDRSETQFLIDGRPVYDPLPRIDAQVSFTVPF